MTDRIVIKGVRPYDGEYELDTDRAFNTREWNWIKRISGYMPLTVSEGFVGGDPSLFVAVAVIAMCRAGKITRDDALRVADEISEAPYALSTITIVGDPVEDDDALPPALTSEPVGSSPTSSLENAPTANEKPSSSGESSKTSSDQPVATLLRTGTGG